MHLVLSATQRYQLVISDASRAGPPLCASHCPFLLCAKALERFALTAATYFPFGFRAEGHLDPIHGCRAAGLPYTSSVESSDLCPSFTAKVTSFHVPLAVVCIIRCPTPAPRQTCRASETLARQRITHFLQFPHSGDGHCANSAKSCTSSRPHSINMYCRQL